MKQSVLLLLFLSTLFYLPSCCTLVPDQSKCADNGDGDDDDDNLVSETTLEASGRWEPGGGKDYNSYRNDQYLIDVIANNVTININLTSPETAKGQIFLVDDKGTSIESSRSGVDVTIEDAFIVEKGTYRIVATTGEFNIGDYQMKVTGKNIENLRQIPVTAFDASDEWESGGGYEQNSFRNHHYTFVNNQVNSYVDITLESLQEARGRVIIVNDAGTKIEDSNTASLSSVTGFLIINPGTYTIVASVEERHIGNYNLTLYGEEGVITDFTRIASASYKKDGTWTLGKGHSHDKEVGNPEYSFEVETPNTYVDLTLDATEAARGKIHLLNEARTKIEDSGTAAAVSIDAFLVIQPGKYYVVVSTEEGAIGDYTLKLFAKEGTILNGLREE